MYMVLIDEAIGGRGVVGCPYVLCGAAVGIVGHGHPGTVVGRDQAVFDVCVAITVDIQARFEHVVPIVDFEVLRGVEDGVAALFDGSRGAQSW